MAERWEWIVGYEGLYEVSDLGQVCSYHYGAPRLLKPHRRKDGHLEITLVEKGRRRTGKVHLLMLEAFIGPRPKEMISRHLDGIPDHNVLSNLEYAAHARNIQDKKWHKGPNRYHKLSPADVRNIKARLGPPGAGAQLAREFGVSSYTISAIKRGHIHTDVAA